jgi:hypothetical protein
MTTTTNSKMKIKISHIIIATLVAIIFWLSKCSDGKFVPTGKTDTQYIETVKWDTLTKNDTVIKPKWKKVVINIHDTLIDSIPYPVYGYATLTEDTVSIINDSTRLLVVYKIYSQNPLIKIEKGVDLSVKRKTITKIITKEIVRKHALFVGPSVGMSKNSGYLMMNGLYEYKGKTIYNLGLGVTTNQQPLLKVGIYWQILK